MFQTNEDLNNHLQEQLQFIEASCNSFDNGFEGEAKRLATAIRILVHDTDTSKSLLSQLNKKDIKFLSTCIPYHPNNLVSFSGLTSMGLGIDGVKYIAPLDDDLKNRQCYLYFNDWRNEIIFIDDNKNKITRKEIILRLANKDGGTHIDPKLNKIYANLSRKNSMGRLAQNETGEIKLNGVELVAVRQISHEILKTFIDGYGKGINYIGNEFYIITSGVQVYYGD